MPLYSIQQGVIHSGYFDGLTDEIGRYPNLIVEDTVGTEMEMRSEYLLWGIGDGIVGMLGGDSLDRFLTNTFPPNTLNFASQTLAVSVIHLISNKSCEILLSQSTRTTHDEVGSKHFSAENFPVATWGMNFGLDAGHSNNTFVSACYLLRRISLVVLSSLTIAHHHHHHHHHPHPPTPPPPVANSDYRSIHKEETQCLWTNNHAKDEGNNVWSSRHLEEAGSKSTLQVRPQRPRYGSCGCLGDCYELFGLGRIEGQVQHLPTICRL